MQEIELKFQIPQGVLAALKAELAVLPGGAAPPQRLQAAYFDTPDRKLARARAALRVRQEDNDWVQTLKAAGANAMTRLEDNRPAPAFGAGEPIRPDLLLHTAAPVREALARDLAWDPMADPRGEQVGLTLLYRTDMRRTRARLDSAMGKVEIALDEGLIASDSGGEVPRQIAVCELEIELVEGHAQAVLDAARALVQRHGLWLDTRTKAHRGDQLAREAHSGKPSPLPPSRPRTPSPSLANDAAPSRLTHWRSALDTALDHISGNLSEVALLRDETDPAPDLSPWIHGWACGVRRLAWVCGHAPEEAADASELDALKRSAQALFKRLRRRPRACMAQDDAIALARSAGPTLLAIDVLGVIVNA